MADPLRSKIIRLAYQNPALRPHLLPLLHTAKEHSSPEALKQYLKEHPNADPSNHTVKEDGGDNDKGKNPAGSSKDVATKDLKALKGPEGAGISKDDYSARAFKAISYLLEDMSGKKDLQSASQFVSRTMEHGKLNSDKIDQDAISYGEEVMKGVGKVISKIENETGLKWDGHAFRPAR